MSDPCEHLETCGFFQRYRSQSEVVKQTWTQMFCLSNRGCQHCERRRIRAASGMPPPDNLTPTGVLL
jgi:hypothetical protein